MSDPRRAIPRTDVLLARSAFTDAAARLGPAPVRAAIRAAQERARQGLIPPDAVEAVALSALESPAGVRAVLNATGVVVHTNLGRAPLSDAAVAALAAASGYTDLELDLDTNTRTARGAAVRTALLAACPGAEDALVVNNGAAALVLAVTALAQGGEVIVSRGELVEIGDGFRIGDLITSTGARLREVGATNRTHLADYADALGSTDTAIPLTSGRADPSASTGPERAARAPRGLLLKVHPSNFRIEGFAGEVGVAELAAVAAAEGVPLVVDIGSGLLTPDAALPDEPAASATLALGADLVVCSADKLLGGPQAGLILGRADLIGRLRRHPLARAFRVDKLTLAALEATLTAEIPPVTRYRTLTADDLRPRAEALAAAVGGDVVACQGRIGGGGAPGVDLPGWAVALPGDAEALAAALRSGTPAVLARIERGRCLIDPRCVPLDADAVLAGALRSALAMTAAADPALAGVPGPPAGTP